MQREGLKPGIVTYLCVLKGIMSTQLQHNGKHIHHGIIHDNFESDEAIGNMLVDMYAKFGSIEDAFKVFDGLKNPSYHCQTHSTVQEKTTIMNKIWLMVVIYQHASLMMISSHGYG